MQKERMDTCQNLVSLLRRGLLFCLSSINPLQGIIQKTSPGISWEGMMLKLKLQYFGHLMRRVDSLEKTLMLGGIGGRRRRGRQRMRRWMASLTRWTWVWVNSRSWWWTGRPGRLQSMGSRRVGHDWASELNWTELKMPANYFNPFILPH